MTTYTILIVDSEIQTREYISEAISRKNLRIDFASDGNDAVQKIPQDSHCIIISAMNLPEMDGIKLVRYLREHNPEALTILYSGNNSIKSAVDAMKYGAFDYLQKPFKAEDVRQALNDAIEYLDARDQNLHAKQQLKTRYTFDNIIGSSPKIKTVFGLIEKVAGRDSTVLILGESGTGKELIARAIHFNSPRADNPFVPVNCGAIPEELLESELFGHEKGAFTGAFRTRIGRFELADSGTIFLDEIAEMSPNLQVKLLRVLQEKEFERVGGAKTIKTDVRIIAATNKNLDDAVERGRFREDLYYRLNVIPINLPPLRERTGDVELLIRHFLEKYSASHPCSIKKFTKDAIDAMDRYKWPGNVRELENLVERLAVLCEQTEVCICDLPEKIATSSRTTTPSFLPHFELPVDGIDLSSAVSEFEKNIIVQALDRTHWVKNQAAQLLKVNRTTLVEKIKKQNLAKNDPDECDQPAVTQA